MPLQATSGAASYDAFGGGVPAVPNYIEDVFSTYLYTGNGSTQTITNGIDLSTKGGLVWIKNRTYAGTSNTLYDTLRGINKSLESNTAGAQVTGTNELTAFNASGFTLGSSSTTNWNTYPYVSWTFRKQPKFFDVVTYTGNGSAVTVNHNLGSTPGCIIIKATSNSGNWHVWHRSVVDGSGYGYLVLNTADATAGGKIINSTSSTDFVVASGLSDVGYTYVCYVFAHDAGGFGLTGTDNVISCGSYTGNGSASGQNITLGYEPQWLLVKGAVGTGTSWYMLDNMRGITTGGNDPRLQANQADAEFTSQNFAALTATGFQVENDNIINLSGTTYIYIAIRRGPMKVPTSGTSVFSPNTTSDDGNAITTGFPVDMFIEGLRAGNAINQAVMDRLRGNGLILTTSSTAVENPVGEGGFASNTTIKPGLFGGGSPAIVWNFKRAPSFFDVVCYTGTGSATTQTHNLAAVPELMIVKRRSAIENWQIYSAALGTGYYLQLTQTNGASTVNASARWNSTTPTSSIFSIGTHDSVNASGSTYVAYLFATCAGVSKVGSYVGTHDTTGPQTIDCGFTSGARFVMIKIASSSSYGWWVFDTARGINPPLTGDPYLELNSTSAENTLDMINPDSSGFIAWREATNLQGQTYIFLAIA